VSDRYRRALVERLQATDAIRGTDVRAAFLEVPRESFLPGVAEEHGVEAVYRDEAYPTKTDVQGNAISSSSQPGIMASMLEALNVSPGLKVLEIGTGTGYNAALLSRLVGPKGRVTSVELDRDVARTARRVLGTGGYRVNVVVGDGRRGWARGAPYDRIILTASSLDVPAAFLHQLQEGGLIVMPLRLSDAVPFRQVVVAFERVGQGLRSVSVIHGGFMRLRERPDDPSIPWTVWEVSEIRDGTRRVVASLSGPTRDALSSHERGQILGLILTAPRSRDLRVRASGRSQWGLETFLTLAVPENQLVGCTRSDLEHLLFYSTALPGVIDLSEQTSLAHLGGGKTISRILAYGGRAAERLLSDFVDDWRRRGRPDVSRLRVEVVYSGRPARSAWRTKRRGSSTVLFDWD
jgi:protein-L-isoaspartate(D-aspartate) O-methyltransferase